MPEHRWSGWPGAWCLDCGCEDPGEIALAEGRFDVEEINGKEVITIQGVTPEMYECPEPGSKRHDPYVRKTMTDGNEQHLSGACPIRMQPTYSVHGDKSDV